MLQAEYCGYRLNFCAPAVTSRAVMTSKLTYFIKLWYSERPDVFGVGECALFEGLSAEDGPGYENKLAAFCQRINSGENVSGHPYSSIRFGYESALLDLQGGGKRQLFDTDWSRGRNEIPINGLVWMGSAEEMSHRVDQKIKAGFRCVKFKVGGVDFNDELRIIERIRQMYPPESLEIRLDANGAFSPENAMSRLNRLSVLDVHSIEQPIKPRQIDEMQYLCASSPIPIALDEELIGVDSFSEKKALLEKLSPAYIILKPALCGGLSGAGEWISVARTNDIKWWATSALESNIGLNAIAQWVSTFNVDMPQGLGTGALYTNNITSPICQERDVLRYDLQKQWEIPSLPWKYSVI